VKGTVRIISGTLRGKVIPFLNSRYGDADITSQKVKGALFSMLGEHLNGKVFVDLFSGSGQIGVEALSRGADLVVFNESDRSRFRFIKDFADAIRTENNSIILNMMAEDALKYISARGIKADIIFVDPPYEKVKGTAYSYSSIIEIIGETGVSEKDGIIVIQHFTSNILPERCSVFTRSSIKKYGTTSISLYAKADN
jgi:16S rRNA (guanine(966)-N(2))-methyltransferase RsmD